MTRFLVHSAQHCVVIQLHLNPLSKAELAQREEVQHVFNTKQFSSALRHYSAFIMWLAM